MPKDTIKTPSKLTDDEMVIALHNAARIFESADTPLGPEMRAIADRFAEMSKKLKKVEAANLSEDVFDHAIWVNAVNRLDGLVK